MTYIDQYFAAAEHDYRRERATAGPRTSRRPRARSPWRRRRSQELTS